MTLVVVSGYASLDHAMRVTAHAARDRTAIIEDRLSEPWPTPGGAAYVARSMAYAGVAPSMVTWVAQDEDGQSYVDHLRADGIVTHAVDLAGRRSPRSYLFYDHDGRAACYFDPGDVAGGLTERQQALIPAADWWCIAVGPAEVNRAVVDGLPPDASLAWVVKADETAFPSDIIQAIVRRADVVLYSDGERSFLEDSLAPYSLHDVARDDALHVETRGPRGVSWHRGGQEGTVDVTPLDVRDTTGAGDMFAGAVVARLIRGQEASAAITAGVEAVENALKTRMEE